MTGSTAPAGDLLTGALGRPPSAAISLGSGLASTAKHLELEPVATFPQLGLPPSGVAGHAGQVSAGHVAGVPVVAFEGRVHLYEGHSLSAVTAWVRVALDVGIRTFVLTNAAGGLAPGLRPGDIMLLTDHISLPNLGGYPAVASAGPQDYPWPRFTGQDGLYDPRLADAVRRAARRLGLPLTEGVYAMVHGPAYETPAERRALHRLGADAVGMSTAPEALAAFAGGGRVLALSVITNVAEAAEPPTHDEVTRVSLSASERLARVLKAALPALT